uniref:Skp1 domain-containing protein n=1 Tax=Rhabditophanes sp. KR3021 TaxID=114890 RepID=A0AC35U245_9BILA
MLLGGTRKVTLNFRISSLLSLIEKSHDYELLLYYVKPTLLHNNHWQIYSTKHVISTIACFFLYKDELDIPMFVIQQSGTLKQMVSDLGLDLEKCNTYSLKKTIEFCEFYDSLPTLDDNSTKRLIRREYNFVLILVADFLDIPKMFTVLCDDVADSMRGKTVEEWRERFDIVDDFTEEDHEYLNNQNAWLD